MTKNFSSPIIAYFFWCRGETRTPKGSPPIDFESIAVTNFATPACRRVSNTRQTLNVGAISQHFIIVLQRFPSSYPHLGVRGTSHLSKVVIHDTVPSGVQHPTDPTDTP